MAVDTLHLAGAPRAAVPQAGPTDKLAAAFAEEEREGRRLAFRGRTIALVAIALLLPIMVPFPRVLYYQALLGVFILLGYLRNWVDDTGRFRPWQAYAYPALDFALLAFTLIYPNPFAGEYPPQLALRTGNFVYFYVLLVGLAFSYRPRLVLWGGAIGAFCWTVGVAWLVSLPDTVLVPEMREMGEEHIGHVMPDTFVDLDTWVQDVSVFFIVAALLALIVGRSRRLVFRQATLERERSNLARYFPPATVDRLARRDAALSQVREQDCAVLFVDLVAFTTWSERHGPREVIDLLREVHERLEVAVFEHEGTLDKFIGDGLMATFGTPDPGLRDATNAIACVRSVLASFEAWNRQRARAGQEPVRVSLGLHYGPVVIGDIGTNRRLEFAVLGDTVNVASRLEALTRELRCRAVVSAAVAEALAHETADDAAELLKDFEERGPQVLRGRHESVAVWTHA